MPESQPQERPRNAGAAERVPNLDARQMEELTDLVYKLMRDEIVLERERSGRRSIRR